MTAVKSVGFLAGAVQVAAGAIHSIMGWPQVATMLRDAGLDTAAVNGFAIPWHFTGAGMVVLGLITIVLIRGANPSAPMTRSALKWLAAVYLASAVVAAVFAGMQPGLAVLVLPGALLLGAAMSPRQESD